MRIKEFSTYFDVKKSTVRYYTDIKLLMPEKIDGYADYTDDCIKDMDDVIRLKNMGFSIKEVQFLKAHERFNVNYSEDERQYLDTIFDNKIEDLKNEIKDLSNKIEDIKDYKNNLVHIQKEKPFGLPLKALEILSCPVCDGRFSVEGASINHNMIFSGHLECKCGKILSIQKGLVTDSETISSDFEKMANKKKSKPQITNEHINNIKATGLSFSKYLKDWDHSKGILIPNADLDLLIMKTDDIFKDDGLYILCSYYLEAIMNLKTKMEGVPLKGSFVFMHLLEEYPVIKSIPYVIENGGNICDMIRKKAPDYNLMRLKPFVNEKSMWLSVHVGLSDAGFSLNSSDNRLEYLLINKYQERFRQIGMAIFDEHEIATYETIKGTGDIYAGIETLTLRFQMLKSI